MTKLMYSMRGNRVGFPWNEMERDDYFEVPVALSSRNSIASTACHEQRKHRGMLFKTEAIVVDGREYTRCTRIK